MHLLPSADFFKINFFDFLFMKTTKSKVSNALDIDQDSRIQIKTGTLSVLTCVKTACKEYQQKTN